LPGESAETLGLTGVETYTIRGLADLGVASEVTVELDGGARSFRALARLDAEADVTVYRDGGLLQMMMLQLAG
ncbi:MAG: aconitate hydratase, partial [Gaiellales bacterium]|nr:aconitate hydratase [Gaiellales bacterium]